MKKRKGYTLAELLVVIGIIALLIGLLMRVLARVRRQSQNTACRAALHDIGLRFQMYLQDSHNKLPWINTMPSIQPPLNGSPSLVYVLEPYTKGAVRSYRCPADRITLPSPGSPEGYETYFDREGSSYQYNPLLATLWAGHDINDKKMFNGRRTQQNTALVQDYEAFHDAPGTADALNVLYMDMHVTDLSQ